MDVNVLKKPSILWKKGIMDLIELINPLFHITNIPYINIILYAFGN